MKSNRPAFSKLIFREGKPCSLLYPLDGHHLVLQRAEEEHHPEDAVIEGQPVGERQAHKPCKHEAQDVQNGRADRTSRN